MLRYLCVSGPALAERRRQLERGGLPSLGAPCVVDEPELAVWVLGQVPVRRLAGGGVLIGDLFPRPGQPVSPGVEALVASLPAAPEDAGRRLVRELWGAYVGLFPLGPDDLRVLRDPGGGVECLAWRGPDLLVVASDLEAASPGLLPRTAGLDWDVIADMLDDPVSAVAQVAIRGLQAVQPGRLERVGAANGMTLWAPADFAVTGPQQDPEGEDLVRAVDHCVRALTRDHARLVGEISGGLDSAIVASSLAAQGHAEPVAAWLNFYSDRPEGDERRYARELAQRHGLALREIPKRFRPLSEDDFRSLCGDARPPVGAADPVRDEETVRQLAEAGASAMLSGQGGDAVFFQPPTPLVLADRIRLEGWRGLRPSALVQASRLSRRSVWSALWTALRSGGPDAPPAARLGLPAGWSRRPRRYLHPWYAGGDDLPPAKRLQAQALANAQLARADSRRRRAAGQLYPLLAQPVVEHALAIPTYALARDGRERGLARHAFRRRLPESLVARHGKGDLSVFYGHMVAASLGFLRPHLLDGVLCEAGLLDRRAVDPLLTPEQLILRGGASGILQATIIESWVREWQARLPDSPAAPRPWR